MGKTKCSYSSKFGGKQGFYDETTYETYHVNAPKMIEEDFVGADVVIPASGSVESGCKWSKKIVGIAPPTVAKVADGVNGLVLLSLTAASQKQDAALHMNDETMCSIYLGAIFETRLALTTLPTLLSVASFGLWNTWADGGSAYRLGFEVPAGGAVTCECDDNATDTAALAGVTMVAGTYYTFRIDASVRSNIKFYINGARVAGTTTFNSAVGATTGAAQPHLGLYKASGAGLGVMSVDYVKVWQNRA